MRQHGKAAIALWIGTASLSDTTVRDAQVISKNMALSRTPLPSCHHPHRSEHGFHVAGRPFEARNKVCNAFWTARSVVASDDAMELLDCAKSIQ